MQSSKSKAEDPAGGREFAIPEMAVLLLYIGLTVWMSIHHEPGPDEAQSWLLARDNSLFHLLMRSLHYEGTPGLWHLLLWVEIRLGLGFWGMHLISIGAGATAMFLLLRFSPIVRWAKLLLPFTVAYLYQGPVIARSYVVATLLIIVLAWLYRSHPLRVMTACVTSGLLANTSLYGALVSAGFVWLFLGRQFLRERRVSKGGVIAVCLFWGVAVYQALPAPDGTFGDVAYGVTSGLRSGKLADGLAVLTGTPKVDPAVLGEVQAFGQSLQQAPPPSERPAKASIARTYPKAVLKVACFLISDSALFALLFYTAFCVWLVSHRQLQIAIPFALLVFLGTFLHIWEHHMIMLWGTLVGVLWMAWPSGDSHRRYDILFQLLLGATLLQQIAWSSAAYRFDLRNAFDPGIQVADFLKENTVGRRVDSVTYFGVSVAPYLAAARFNNMSKGYWRWSIGGDPDLRLDLVVEDHPDLIIASLNTYGPVSIDNEIHTIRPEGYQYYGVTTLKYLQANGYLESHRFCGRQPSHLSYVEQNCTIILEPVQRSR